MIPNHRLSRRAVPRVRVQTLQSYFLSVLIGFNFLSSSPVVLSYIMDLTIEVKHKFNYYFALLLLSLYWSLTNTLVRSGHVITIVIIQYLLSHNYYQYTLSLKTGFIFSLNTQNMMLIFSKKPSNILIIFSQKFIKYAKICKIFYKHHFMLQYSFLKFFFKIILIVRY